MNKNPLIYEFQTESGNRYLYDACTNYTYPVDKIDIDLIKHFNELKSDIRSEVFIQKYSKEEFEKSFQKISDWIEHDKAFFPPWKGPDKFLKKTDYERELANSKQLTLELTQKCNMRCTYCIYNDYFPMRRNHGRLSMTWTIAKKSIDYYIELINSPLRTASGLSACVSFYGGEPILQFPLLKRCVEYIKKERHQDDIFFSMTTNATLLTKEIIEFLINYDFNLLISFDGDSKEHDKNRVLINGSGTHHIISNNLEAIKRLDSNYLKRKVRFNAVYTYNSNIFNVFSYYKTLFQNDFDQMIRVRFSQDITERYRNTGNNHKSINKNFKKQIQMLHDWFIRLEKDGEADDNMLPILECFFGHPYFDIKKRTSSLPHIFKLKGATCIPGERKIYVAADGKFYTCEQIEPYFDIGDFMTGVDYQKAKNIYNQYREKVINDCHRCIAIHNCSVCIANVAKNGKLAKGNRCNIVRKSFKKLIKSYYSILEENPKAFNTAKTKSIDDF